MLHHGDDINEDDQRKLLISKENANEGMSRMRICACRQRALL